MSETTWIAMAGILSTLIGALGASWLTARAAAGTAKEERREIRKQALRESLARTIVALKEWGTAQHTHNLFLATLTSREQLKQYLDESIDSWTMERLRDTGEELRRALTQTKLLVGDPELLAALDETDVFQRISGEEMFKEISERIYRGEDSTRRAGMALALSDQYDEAVAALEMAARKLLAARVTE